VEKVLIMPDLAAFGGLFLPSLPKLSRFIIEGVDIGRVGPIDDFFPSGKRSKSFLSQQQGTVMELEEARAGGILGTITRKLEHGRPKKWQKQATVQR